MGAFTKLCGSWGDFKSDYTRGFVAIAGGEAVFGSRPSEGQSATAESAKPRGKLKAPKSYLAGGAGAKAEAEVEACMPPRKKSRGGMGPSKGASKGSSDSGEGL